MCGLPYSHIWIEQDLEQDYWGMVGPRVAWLRPKLTSRSTEEIIAKIRQRGFQNPLSTHFDRTSRFLPIRYLLAKGLRGPALCRLRPVCDHSGSYFGKSETVNKVMSLQQVSFITRDKGK